MSCSSPFEISQVLFGYEYDWNIKCSGNTIIPAYSTPSIEICCWDALSCGTWSNTGCTCNWKDCYTIPGIPLWPELKVAGSANIQLVYANDKEEAIIVEGPTEPYSVLSVTIQNPQIGLSINGIGTTLTFPITEILEYSSESGFSTSIQLPSVYGSYVYLGTKINIQIKEYIVFCLNPVPPVGWINVQLQITLSYETFSSSFTLDIPIVSTEV